MEETIVSKYAFIEPALDERSRRLWAATESFAIGYGSDALVSAATGLARATIRGGRRELEEGVKATKRMRRPGGGRHNIEKTQAGVKEALEALIDPLTRGDRPIFTFAVDVQEQSKSYVGIVEEGVESEFYDNRPPFT